VSLVRRRRLASELRRLREAAQLTCEEVAVRLDCSASKISRIETGRVLVSPRDVRDLLSIYGVPEDQRGSLIQLARDSRQKGWWHSWGDVQPHLATYLALESEASEIRQYAVARIPNLLQTEDYARAVVTGGRAGTTKYPGPADRIVEMFMERQRLATATRQGVQVVMDEAGLRRQVSGREVMRQQIEHLIELSSVPTMVLQCIPFTSGAHVALDLPFVVLGFADPADPDVVAVGYPTGVLWLEDTAEVHSYNTFFRHLQAAALSPRDSAALITSVLKDL
jgi:transcriptional regulator with XRE-family HTH domain